MRIADGRYVLECKLHAHHLYVVYEARDSKTDQAVQVRMDPQRRTGGLAREAGIRRYLEGGLGMPKVHWCGSEGHFNALVLEPLGPSLRDLCRFCRYQLSELTVCRLGEQLLNRLEYIHSKGMVHRDIRPDTFRIGLGDNIGKVYFDSLILAKRFLDPSTRRHVVAQQRRSAEPKGSGAVWNALFASLPAHQGMTLSRRDDIESLGYMLVYLCKGFLPWQELSGSQQDMYRMKRSMQLEALCDGCPGPVAALLLHGRALGFEERPDYAHLHRLLQGSSLEVGSHDFACDWTVKRSELSGDRLLSEDGATGSAASDASSTTSSPLAASLPDVD